jgi:fumarate reductase subunit D
LGNALQLDSFLAWTEQPLVKFGEWAIVLALAAHLAGGLRVLAIEFLDWHEWQKSLAAVAAAVTLAVGLAFALAL